MIKQLCILLLYFWAIAVQGQDRFLERLNDAAISLTLQEVRYDPGYYSMEYPNGDVPADRGVCTDVIIRAYRKVGIDLQREVHEDMKLNFNDYPQLWGMGGPDPNIDHRRVPNLICFFQRHGLVRKISQDPEDYVPGDIVCWNLGGSTTHIGFVVDQPSDDGLRYQVVHNIGSGQVMEDCLFDFRIIGHFQYIKE
jgi:uncharacterized protein YijF (DUF1287 family)